jgi:hypothetical protein
MRKSLLAGVAFLAMVITAGAHEEQVTLDRVVFVTSPKWYVLRDLAVIKDVLYFRKYALAVIDERLGPAEKVKNITTFACKRDSRLWDHWAIHLPAWVKLQTIDENAWISKMDLRVMTDDGTFTADGEYFISTKKNRDKEFFIDLTPVNRISMLGLLASSRIIVEFGPAQERIGIRQMSRTPDGTGNIEGFVDVFVPEISKAINGGAVRSFSTDSMLKACAEFKKTGRYWSDERRR